MDVPCLHCGTLHWLNEKLVSSDSNKCPSCFSLCCMEGKIVLPILQLLPEPLCYLLTSDDHAAVKFCEDMWKYNCAFAFTSLGICEQFDQNVEHKGLPIFKIYTEL
ncbi:hypothetical protein BDN70DRAFT_817394 [Pholiota conissans]|uniref:Uncharacterized protein n=1 Tax=Pholiota conissans TaxID=109636 RepID=A0A9P5YQ29_9AGAR|nr:hypothetical protein BDN70DRAFT_817394 [Pholiota conissans]